MSEIIFDRVYKRYGEHVAVNSVSFQAERGEFISLLGPSGCGKTTLLRLVAGLIAVDGGDILIRGRSMKNVPPNKRDVAIVFQSYALFPHMTVAQNVAFGLQMRGVARSEIGDRVRQALAGVRLPGFADRYPSQLSGGQQQRVALARALVCQPAVLLLDEPLAALDKNLRKEMQIELKQLQRQAGVTTVFVTHDQEEALALSDRILVMNNGSVEQMGTPLDIYTNPKTRFVLDFVGDSNAVEGKIVNDASGCYFVAEQLRLPVAPARPQGVAVFALRPEQIELFAAQPASSRPSLRGEIANVVYLGSHDYYVIRMPWGTTFSASARRRHGKQTADFAPGTPVWLSWEEAAGSIVEKSAA